tara:strand:+ start:53 stop:241 length:189 start_codon:yes stop_codon:yes gene_type:complete
MFSYVFLTGLIFSFAVGSAMWFVINVWTSGPVWLSLLVSIISGVTWVCFGKMLGSLQFGDIK